MKKKSVNVASAKHCILASLLPILLALSNAYGLESAAPAVPVAPVAAAQTAPTPVAATKAVKPRRKAGKSTVAKAPRGDIDYLPPQALLITLGEIKLVPVDGKVTRVALGSGSILSTTTVDAKLLLIAEQVGTTTLIVWTDHSAATYRVQVVPRDLADVRAKIDALIGKTPTITVQQVGTQFVLAGSAHAEALKHLASGLQDVPNIIFNVHEDQGSPYTRSVLFRLHFIEVKRALLEQIGIDWSKQANGPVFGVTGVAKNEGVYRDIPQVQGFDGRLDPVPKFVRRGGNAGGVFLGLASTLTSRINLGISDGDARVLASPELTAKSGGKARLQVGGEVPIPLSGAFGATTVEFKPYGIIFSIEPNIDANDVITARVSTELSQIDPAVSVAGIPGFITRSTSTDVSVKPGEMVALSGLVNNELSNAMDRVPGLSAIPIFGRLFRSDDFKNSKTELVVLLETEIISAGDGLARQLRDRGLADKAAFEKKVEQASDHRPTHLIF